MAEKKDKGNGNRKRPVEAKAYKRPDPEFGEVDLYIPIMQVRVPKTSQAQVSKDWAALPPCGSLAEAEKILEEAGFPSWSPFAFVVHVKLPQETTV